VRRVPAGTTLVELLVALTLFGIVAVACLRALAMSGRWYERTTLAAEQHAQADAVRRLVSALPTALSPADGDLLTAGDSAMTWQATVGSAVVCNEAGGSFILPRAALTSGVDLASYSSAPQVGDAIVALHDGPTPSPSDDLWSRHTIVGVHTSTGGCVGGPLADPVADASTPAWRLDASPVATAADVGAPVRILRPRRLVLYLSAPDWMLGFTEWNSPAGWAALQPAAGPLSPPRPPTSGIRFAWLDSLMQPDTSAPSAIAVMIRAPTRRPVRAIPGGQPAPMDSLGFVVALRNRR
jgi:prepilin-type N-terminal cleavage/methylation domain-containing protein